MNRDDRNLNPDVGTERNRAAELPPRRDETVSDRDTDLQREGNLGNERNRNRPDRDRGHSDIDDLER